jgi:DmsE family decaheme c-type cytochrome
MNIIAGVGPSRNHFAARKPTLGVRPRFAVLGLLLLALPCAPTAQAFDGISLAGVNSVFGANEQPATVRTTSYLGGGENDAAFAALRSFAQGLTPAAAPAAPANENSEDAALRAYASTLGNDPADAHPAAGMRLAAADKPKKPAAVPTKAAAGTEPVVIGSKACLTCHAAQTAAFNETLMGRINKTRPGQFECENCHGPGSEHVRLGGGRGVGGIISFRPDDTSHSAAENNAICLGCHERGDRTYWSGSTHETRGLQCSNCHTVMRNVSLKKNLKTAWELDTCFQCHKDRRAQLYRTSHMPLREGKMVCSDCHNPHGSATEAMLREDSINDNCYKCHAEKRGPFLFEHLPVRENCDNCHDPHGSINEHMLRISTPRLCSECHTFDHGPQIAAGPNVVQGFGRACLNCHTQVHGSNSPSGALFLR